MSFKKINYDKYDVLGYQQVNAIQDAILENERNFSSGLLHIASGSYTGTGTSSVTIETPGFKPLVVMMRNKDMWCDNGTNYSQSMEVEYGWVLWMGENSITLHPTPGASTGITTAKIINFNATNGSLSWSADDFIPNNSVSKTYQWVAFGRKE